MRLRHPHDPTRRSGVASTAAEPGRRGSAPRPATKGSARRPATGGARGGRRPGERTAAGDGLSSWYAALRVPLPRLWRHLRGQPPDERGGHAGELSAGTRRHGQAAVHRRHGGPRRRSPRCFFRWPCARRRRRLLRRGVRLRLSRAVRGRTGSATLSCRGRAQLVRVRPNSRPDPSERRATRGEPSRYVTRSAVRDRRCRTGSPSGVGRGGNMVTDRFYDVRYACGATA